MAGLRNARSGLLCIAGLSRILNLDTDGFNDDGARAVPPISAAINRPNIPN
ncbi:hypothetical protein [Paraburkholderia sp. EG304]|uniref:hypothetical protein n=1 Tax=Paraburkholderia sp. EG304 TaxID=3237015 RepID=UPI00397B4FEE